MSSPFTLFRKHQRVMMVVVTGLAMISFVLLGAVDDPRNLPTPLVVLFLAALIGGVGWVAGLAGGKASEWGISGALIGALLGVALVFYNREASAVQIDSGNLSQQQISQLRRQRFVANQFLQMAFTQSKERQPFEYYLFQMQGRLFGFMSLEDVSVQDVVLGELLRREADQMGLTIGDDAIVRYIKEVTGDAMTSDLFKKIRQQLKVSETELMSALRSEMKARRAFEMLYGANYLPPEALWRFHRQLNVKQNMEVAQVPIADYIDNDAAPPEVDLQQLFVQFQGNFPGFTPDGRPAEGRPGFRQPRRMKLGYLEAVYDTIEPLVGEVSEEEIQQRYEERYLRAMPADSDMESLDLNSLDLKLPDLELPPAPSDSSPASEPAPPSDAAPESPAAPATEAQPAPGDSETPAPTPEASEPPAPATDDSSSSDSSSSTVRSGALQFVSFQDEPAADAPVESTPAAESTPEPATEAPAEEKPASPANETPAAPADPMPADESAIPPAPKSAIPPLDDALKQQLRDDILREKTQREIQRRIEDAYSFLSQLGYKMQLPEGEASHVSSDSARKQIDEYAEKNQLVYIETPLLSYQELRESEDYPLGAAFNMDGQPQSVADAVFQSLPSQTYSVSRANNFSTDSSYVYIKLEDRPDFVPETLDADKAVREQVIAAWRRLQAEPKAKARAEEIAALVRKSDKSMTEALQDVTVTGREGGLFLTVQQTGDVSWMQRSAAPPTSFSQSAPVRPSTIPGVENPGERFYETVFDSLQPGEVGVVPNANNSAIYIVKVTQRTPASPEELDAMRKQFLAAGRQDIYQSLGQQTLRQYSFDWMNVLFRDHNVRISANADS